MISIPNLHYSFPVTQQVYFSLGEAVAAVGLIFAVFQLSKPIWNTAHWIKGSFKRQSVWILTALGLISVFVSALLQQPSASSALLKVLDDFMAEQ